MGGDKLTLKGTLTIGIYQRVLLVAKLELNMRSKRKEHNMYSI